ncbi:4Fe-4S binding protein [Sedimentibacter sp. zth1]|uniref:4Fe-4S binding protein n=1 Tax=Sedimentibacter sp. zth1 TaxID=2816908 RepID=UPI001A91B4D3|nr:4Fe-4S binding protein [Sedimentibacter sp. zth1]QSX06495.1 4Fe-4S binding protein [Sedimentibacter sp. zth1]
MKKQKKWYDYLWIFSLTYLILGFFNILFAWIGLLCFFIPLIISITTGSKAYCNNYCGRGQLLEIIGSKFKLSRNKNCPSLIKSKFFRYLFLTFFMTMFANMIYNTYLVFFGTQSLKQVVVLLWTFKMPWNFAYTVSVSPWIAQFSFGFYSLMLTSTILGLITMVLFRPRTWCVYCPMGTMTQMICKAKAK